MSAALRELPAALFALVDPARGEGVYETLLHFPATRRRSLFDEKENPGILAAYAPHLVALGSDEVEHLEALWGDSAVVFLNAAVPFLALRTHFRRFLTVKIDGRPLYFRFYDPRVLPKFLMDARPDELAAFFGPVETFVLETDQGAGLALRLGPAGGVVTRKIS